MLAAPVGAVQAYAVLAGAVPADAALAGAAPARAEQVVAAQMCAAPACAALSYAARLCFAQFCAVQACAALAFGQATTAGREIPWFPARSSSYRRKASRCRCRCRWTDWRRKAEECQRSYWSGKNSWNRRMWKFERCQRSRTRGKCRRGLREIPSFRRLVAAVSVVSWAWLVLPAGVALLRFSSGQNYSACLGQSLWRQRIWGSVHPGFGKGFCLEAWGYPPGGIGERTHGWDPWAVRARI